MRVKKLGEKRKCRGGWKWIKNAVILAVIFAVAAGSLAGCGNYAQENMKEPQIQVPSNHLDSWQEELPQDEQYKVLDANSLRGLVIQEDGEVMFAASYEPRVGKESFDYWDISVPYESMVSVNTESLYNLFDMVLSLGWEKADGVSRKEAGLAKDAEDATSIFLAYDKEQKPGEKGKAKPTAGRRILIGDADGNGHYYAVLDGSDEVALVSRTLVDAILNVDAYSCILKVPVVIGIDTVEQVQIISEKQMFLMEQDADGFKVDGKAVEEKEFKSLYGKLLDIMISGEIAKEGRTEMQGTLAGGVKAADNKGAEGIGSERTAVLTIQFIRNVEGASDVEVSYYKYDEQFMSVSVNGKEYFLVERESIDSLQEVLKTL